MPRQFANDSMTPSPISVSRNAYKDEIPSDRPMHDNSTPEHSNTLYGGNQYAPAIQSGVPVTPSGVSKSVVDVDAPRANRGNES